MLARSGHASWPCPGNRVTLGKSLCDPASELEVDSAPPLGVIGRVCQSPELPRARYSRNALKRWEVSFICLLLHAGPAPGAVEGQD